MNKNKVWIIILIIAIVVVAAIAIGKDKKGDEASPVINDSTVTPGTSSTGGTTSTKGTKPTTTTPTPIPPNTLVILTPTGGEIYHTNQMLTVQWDSSVNFVGTDAKVVVKLMKDGKEIATLTEKGGARADVKSISWKIPDVSLWGEEGYSVALTTSGLAKNLTAQSAAFTISK